MDEEILPTVLNGPDGKGLYPHMDYTPKSWLSNLNDVGHEIATEILKGWGFVPPTHDGRTCPECYPRKCNPNRHEIGWDLEPKIDIPHD